MIFLYYLITHLGVNNLHFIFFTNFFLLFTFRYHDNKMVNYDIQDGFSVSSVQTHQHHSSGSSSSTSGHSSNSHSSGSSSNLTNSLVPPQPPSLPQTSYLKVPSTSVLTIQEVHFKHAGNYTCAPSNARPASITVHVLRGKCFYI